MKLRSLTLSTALLSIFLTSASAQSFLTNGLVAYYPFNSNANDASGNGINGTVNGATLIPDRFGIANTAYSFNGIDNYVGFASVPTSQIDNWTMSAWLKPASLNQLGIAVALGYNDQYNGDGHSIGLSSGTGAVTGNQLFGLFGGVAWVNSGFAFTSTNQWYQVVMLRSSGITTFYVNGVLVPNTTTTSPSTPTSFRIGSGNGLWFFNGAIDDVRIYNRALSSNEVGQLFAIETAGPTISAQPTNMTVNVGDTASFSVTATGTAQLNYQWFKDGIGLPNATNAMLVLTNIQPPRIGNYTVTVSDTNGSIDSIAASLSISNVNSALWQGLVAYYPFNGNANDAEGTNNGTIYGGVALAPDRFGSNNSAYTFNGADGYIDIGRPVGNSPIYLTECAWVNIISRATNGYGLKDVIMTERQDPTGADPTFWATLFITPNGKGVLSVDGPYHENDCTGTTQTPINNWVFLCGVVSNGTYQIYINGALENTMQDGTPLSSVYNMYLMHDVSWGTFCHGLLDDVRIYNRSLSSNDVAQLYASEAPPIPPHTATGTATLAGVFIVGVNITDNGGGYTNTPLVRFIGGGGSGAQAVAVVSNGVVVAVNVIDAGSGYTNVPVVVIDPPFISNPVLGIASISFLTFSSLTINSNYQLQLFQSPNWINQSVSFKASDSIYTQIISGAVSSEDYRLALTPVPLQAHANSQVVNGFVVGAFVTAGGSGYTTPPVVNFIGNGNVGSNATAVASVSGGKVTGITITSAGIGYASPVTIQIDPPPVTALSPTVSPGVELDSSSLAPYDNYQIQFTSDIGVAWANLSGGLFSPTSVTNSQYVFLTNDVGFFRLKFLP
jgi:hypothetical protein